MKYVISLLCCILLIEIIYFNRADISEPSQTPAAPDKSLGLDEATDTKEQAYFDIELQHPDREHSERLNAILAKLRDEYMRSKSDAALARVGDLYICYGYHLEALQIFHDLSQHPKPPDAVMFGLALCLDSLGHYQQAISAYRQLIASERDDYDKKLLRHRIAELLLINGETDLALEAFITNYPFPSSLARSIRILLHQNKFDEAQLAFKKLLQAPGVGESIEIIQFNNLAKRLYDKELASVEYGKYRSSIYSYQAIDKFSEMLQDHYGLLYIDLFLPMVRQIPEYQQVMSSFSARINFTEGLGNDEVIAAGEKIFHSNNCVVCHGQDLYGKVAPNLRDDFWLCDGTAASIFDTITYGSPKNTMPSHQFTLDPMAVYKVTCYILNLNRSTDKTDEGKTVRGKAAEGKYLPPGVK